MADVTFQTLLDLAGEEEKLAHLRNLLTEVTEKRLEVKTGLESLLTFLKHEESPAAAYMTWMLLLRGPADERVRNLSRETLNTPGKEGRGKAAAYLLRNFPAESEWLGANYANDSNLEVAFNAARALVSKDPDKAVRTWIKCLDETESLPFWEVVSEYVIAHGDPNHLEEIRKRDLAMGGGSTWQPIAAGIFAAHQAEHLDRPASAVDHRHPVQWTVCDNCRRNIGVRQGKEGERIRCLYCNHVFNLYLGPPETIPT